MERLRSAASFFEILIVASGLLLFVMFLIPTIWAMTRNDYHYQVTNLKPMSMPAGPENYNFNDDKTARVKTSYYNVIDFKSHSTGGIYIFIFKIICFFTVSVFLSSYIK